MTIYENIIMKYLDNNNIRYSDIWSEATAEGIRVTVYIRWGDWKHDHACLRNEIFRVFKPNDYEETVTDEDGSDCYSAEHTFIFTGRE